MRLTHFTLRATVLLGVLGALAACSHQVDGPTTPAATTASPSATVAQSPTPSPSATFDMQALPLDDPTSLWVIVNKHLPLNPATYVPPDLTAISGVPHGSSYQMRAEAVAALQTMYTDAKAAGAPFSITSAYRSYDYQKGLYDPRARDRGVAAADRSTARPGYSEHQTGWATDIYDTDACKLEQCFGATAAGQWVAANSWQYGFVVRYPQDKEGVTGYIWEPWHLRYVGIPLATAMHNSGTPTLEEFFGLAPAPDYPAAP